MIFLYAHIPLLIWLLIELYMKRPSFIVGFNLFTIAHLILHLIYLRHPNNLFTEVSSWALILAAAVFAALDLSIGLF